MEAAPAPSSLDNVGGVARWIVAIPLIWSVIGGSAAFLLGIRADLVLALSGVALLARLVASFTRSGTAG